MKFFGPKPCNSCGFKKKLKSDHLAFVCRKCHKLEEAGYAVIFPIKVGDIVFVRALCECVVTTIDKDTGCFDCPFEDDCQFEECCNANERIFPATVIAIHNEGRGWWITLKNLCFELQLSDIGKTAFLSQEEAENHL